MTSNTPEQDPLQRIPDDERRRKLRSILAELGYGAEEHGDVIAQLAQVHLGAFHANAPQVADFSRKERSQLYRHLSDLGLPSESWIVVLERLAREIEDFRTHCQMFDQQDQQSPSDNKRRLEMMLAAALKIEAYAADLGNQGRLYLEEGLKEAGVQGTPSDLRRALELAVARIPVEKSAPRLKKIRREFFVMFSGGIHDMVSSTLDEPDLTKDSRLHGLVQTCAEIAVPPLEEHWQHIAAPSRCLAEYAKLKSGAIDWASWFTE